MSNKKRGYFDKKKAQAIKQGALYPQIRTFSESEIKPILKEIKSRPKNDDVRKALCNYLIIRSVTILETFLITEAYRLSKIDEVKTSTLFSYVQVGVPLEDQVISAYSFTKLDDIDQVFSTLLGKKFLNEIKNESVQYAPYYFIELAHISYSKYLHKNWDQVLKIFELRHDIVHHDKINDFGYAEIRNIVGGVIQFIMCGLMILE